MRGLGLDAYVVGGAVRDELLGIEAKDADFQSAEQRVYRSPRFASQVSLQVTKPDRSTKATKPRD